MSVSATLQTTRLAVTPGSEASLELRVRNTGAVVDVLTVEVVGDAAAWSVVLPDRVSLFPGGDAVVTVVFRPPMAADGPAGEVPFGLRVRSQEDPSGSGGSVVEEGVLDVAPFLSVDAELQPRTCRGRRRGATTLAVSNRGTRAVTVEITGVEPDGNVKFDIDPLSLTVEPDSASFVKIGLRAVHPFRKGFPLTRQFQVHVTEAGAPAPMAVAAGMFVQEETIPRWVRRAVLWTLVGLLLFLAFWFALGRPAVQSAAKEAAREELTPSTIAATSGSGGGSKAGSGSGAGATPDESGADVSTAGVGSGATSTIDGRLFLAGAGTTAYEVPAGSTLQVTDIVLQNPTGDAGSLQIRRNGTALLVVELSNFRDLDYHFVAPIVFTAGQKLELAAECTAGACTPGAYFAGYVTKG
jgi:hypothetical protein